MRWLQIVGLVGGLTLVASGGYLASEALSQTGEPTRTVTINVATGAQGATGPAGPKGDTGSAGPQGEPGPAGVASDCPAGYTFGAIVVIQQAQGPTEFLACLKN